MKISQSFLGKYVDLNSHEELLEQLTMLGLEVDGALAVANKFDKVVVGEVIACEKHPEADKLQVTKVNVGTEVLDIVCGAKNCRLGLKVCVATPGARLSDSFVIEPVKLRGVASNGMLCSYKELGINIEEDGIIELPVDAPIGQDINQYLDLTDFSIDISITPNRADCLSALGLARDLVALNNLELKNKNISSVEATISEVFPVEIHDFKDCNSYASRVINNIDIAARTPEYIRQTLVRSGIRPLDAIVDITNFVMIELGQPMHAFDKDKLEKTIIVRRAQEAEKLVLLSGEEISLTPEELVIADEQGPIAFAGVFGGKNKSIQEDTKNIVLEVANFNPLTIVNKARKYSLATDSSHKFERGVDPLLVKTAMERATALVLEICGGEAGPINLVTNEFTNKNTIELSYALVNRISGIDFTSHQVKDILTRLGCEVLSETEAFVTIKTPSWRFDLNIAEDLAEEVIRIYGFHNIPEASPVAHLVMQKFKEENLNLNLVKNLLINKDLQEVLTYSFVHPEMQASLHTNEALILPNPISADMSAMRVSLLCGLLNTVKYNQARQQKRIRIFETGLIFNIDPTQEMGIRQDFVLGGLISGSLYEENWAVTNRNVDFFDLKAIVEDVLALTKFAKHEQVRFVKKEYKALHPGQSAAILIDDQEVGFIGALNPTLYKSLKIAAPIFVFQLQEEAINKKNVTVANPISKFTTNSRDLSMLIDKEQPIEDLLRKAKEINDKRLLAVKLFDVFTDDSLGDKKSVAINLSIGDIDKTLEDKEINEVVDAVVNILKESYNIQLREI